MVGDLPIEITPTGWMLNYFVLSPRSKSRGMTVISQDHLAGTIEISYQPGPGYCKSPTLACCQRLRIPTAILRLAFYHRDAYERKAPCARMAKTEDPKEILQKFRIQNNIPSVISASHSFSSLNLSWLPARIAKLPGTSGRAAASPAAGDPGVEAAGEGSP